MLIGFFAPVSFAKDLGSYIGQVEREYTIPQGLLKSIAKVESGEKPFALNIGGKPLIMKTYQEAAAVVKHLLDKGHNNIDVGIMQINLKWHKNSFASIEDMLNPQKNIEYAARLLTNLFKQHGSWHKAVRYYHSANPNHNRKYSRKILVTWLEY